MARDKVLHHESIIEAAKAEFLEYGFQDASMRRIAGTCSMSASGLYKHFPGKEEMFAALVDPVITELMSLYKQLQTEEFAQLNEPVPYAEWTDSVILQVIEFIYDHYEEFRLIVCKSQGTRYEDFSHDIAVLEEQSTLAFIEGLKEKGIVTEPIPQKELHLLVTMNVDAILQVIVHEFTREEALHYAVTLENFFDSGWKKLLGLESN